MNLIPTAGRGYNGYVLERNNRRIIFSGDTALSDSFAELRASGPIDLAIMPIGAYNPWIHSHWAYKAPSRFSTSPAPWWKFMTCRRFKTGLPVAAQSTRRCSLRLSLRAQAAEVEVSLQMRETPEQLLKRLSSGIHRRRL
jgi:Beta-lactamase superfamily domain